MARILICCTALLLVAGAARGDDGKAAKEAKASKDAKVLSGMSIVGNDDAPKSLVIVPWKSSGLGDTLDVGSSLGDAAQPVDRDVFGRELDYYQIRAESLNGGSSAKR